jgi:hypothetical protein
MRKAKPRTPDEVRSQVLWELAEDSRIIPQVRTQLREIARHIDGEQLRWAFFLVRN